MSNDPTTKPCPCVCHKPEEASGHGFRDEYGGWQVENCPTCHGTGRVPMDTGELLEACARRYPIGALSWSNGWEFYEDTAWDSNSGYWQAANRDEALRAALWAVNP